MRHSIGARLSCPFAERKPGWDFDYEALWQFEPSVRKHQRLDSGFGNGYRFLNVPLKPRFSAKADVSSGDDPRANTLGTFNPLFPKGNYFGRSGHDWPRPHQLY